MHMSNNNAANKSNNDPNNNSNGETSTELRRTSSNGNWDVWNGIGSGFKIQDDPPLSKAKQPKLKTVIQSSTQIISGQVKKLQLQ